jgi:hypothetical protein
MSASSTEPATNDRETGDPVAMMARGEGSLDNDVIAWLAAATRR